MTHSKSKALILYESPIGIMKANFLYLSLFWLSQGTGNLMQVATPP